MNIPPRTFKIPVDQKHKNPLASYIEHKLLRHEMILPEKIESKITRIKNEHTYANLLLYKNLKPRRKILFYGPSGCGKSMCAERIAYDLELPFYRVRFDSIFSSFLGETASNLYKLIQASEESPCVILFDEIDMIGIQRKTTANDIGEIYRIVSVLLGLLEDYKGESILIATTNLEKNLDKAMFRRFDDWIKIPKPNQKQILQLLEKSFSNFNLNKDVNFFEWAEKMKDLSCALIVKTINDAAKNTILKQKKEIKSTDIENSFIENNKPI